MLPKQPINATAQLCYSRTPTTSFIVNAEGKATSPRGEPHRRGGSHIAQERKPAANNKKTLGEMSINYKKCSANQRAKKMLTHFVYECVF